MRVSEGQNPAVAVAIPRAVLFTRYHILALKGNHA